MKRTLILKSFPLMVLVGGLVVTLVTSAQNSSGTKGAGTDTIPTKKHKQVRNLDDALLELDRGEIELSKALKEIDTDKIEREIREAMKHMDVDMAKMKEDMAKAMKDIDMEKINADVQKELAEAQKELKEIDVEKIRKQVAASLESVDMEKIKADIANMKKIDMEKMKKELENIRPEIEKSMAAAKKSMEETRKELTAYKNLVDALEKDGHLKKGENYKIEYSNSELTVNGKKLSAEETKKYNQYLNEKKPFTMLKDEGNFNIHHK